MSGSCVRNSWKIVPFDCYYMEQIAIWSVSWSSLNSTLQMCWDYSSHCVSARVIKLRMLKTAGTNTAQALRLLAWLYLQYRLIKL